METVPTISGKREGFTVVNLLPLNIAFSIIKSTTFYKGKIIDLNCTHWHMSRVVCDWSPSTCPKLCCDYNDSNFYFVNRQIELLLMLQFPG